MKSRIYVLVLILLFSLEAKTQTPKVDSLKIILKTAMDDTNKVNTMLLLADELRYNDPEKSIEYSKFSLDLAGKLNFKNGTGKAYLQMGNAYQSLGDYTNSLDSYLRAITQFVAVGNKRAIANTQHNIAAVYVDQNSYKEALKYNSLSLKTAEEINDQTLAGVDYLSFGEIYRNQNNFPVALSNYYKALKLFEATNDIKRRGMVFSNMGLVYTQLGKHEEAISNFNEALMSFEKTGFKRGIAISNENIGLIYAQQNNYNEALKYNLKALAIKKEINDQYGIAISLQNIALNFEAQKKHSEALERNFEALKIFEQIGNKLGVVGIYTNIAEVYVGMERYKEAIAWFNKAIPGAREINGNAVLVEIYSFLAKVYVKTNDYKRAFEYQTLYTSFKDSLLNTESSKQIEEMKTKYETEKKDREIELLSKEKEILSKNKLIQEEEIRQQGIIRNSTFAGVALAGLFSFFLVRSFVQRRKTSFEKEVSEVEMKALRSQMNPHFIFNSLRSINEYIQHSKSTLASEYLVKFSKLMRAILENSRKREITIAEDLNVLELYMQLEAQRMEYPFIYLIEIDPAIDSETALIPPMLLQPILENSIWHGLAPKGKDGKIVIRIRKQNETILCEVEDNGVGRTGSADLERDGKQESFGLKIIAERLAIIEQSKKIKTQFTFIDLEKDGQASGLKICFVLPYEENN